MSRQSVYPFAVLSLAILTLLTVGYSATQVSSFVFGSRLLELGVYMLLTTFAVLLSVPLSHSKLSVAHAVGIMAFLSLDASVMPAMTIAISIGGLVGGIVRMQFAEQLNTKTVTPDRWTNLVFVTARVTLPFFVASRAYIDLFNAPLPLQASNLQSHGLLVGIYVLIYVVLYFIIFVLQRSDIDTQPHDEPTDANRLSLAIILLLPIPFAFIGALVARSDDSLVIFTSVIVETVLIIFGLYALNWSQQQLRRQLDEMRSISVATQAMRTNLELEGLLRTTYVQISQLLSVENFTAALLSTDGTHMDYPLVIRNGNERTIRRSDGLPDDHALIQHIIRTKAPLLISSDVHAHALELGLQPPQKPVTSWLGVPILSGNEAVGTFVVLSYNQRRFDQDDLRLLNILVASTSIAMENARLYSQKSLRAEQLATLNQVTALLTGTLAPDEVLDIIVSSASTISEAHAIAVYIMQEEPTPDLILARSAGLGIQFEQHPPDPILRNDLAHTADNYLQPRSLIIENIRTSTLPDQTLRNVLLDNNKKALIEVPLAVAGMNIGVLGMYFNETQSFAGEQIDLIQAFSTQAAQAIANARTFATTDRALEQRVEQLYALAAMGRLLNATMGTDKIYEVVLTYATDATHAARGAVILLENNQVRVPIQRGYPDDVFEDAQFLRQGLTGRVLRNGQAMRIGDIRTETGYLPLTPQTRSMLLTPIMKRQKVLGMILLEDNKPNLFSESDGHFVAQIANQAVIAADNTQLFVRIREARDNMEAILNSMEEAVLLIDDDGVVVQANPRVELLGLSPDDLRQQPMRTLLDDEWLELAHKLGFSSNEGIERLLADLQTRDDWDEYTPRQYELHDDDYGTLYIQRQIIPIRDEHNALNGALMVFYDKSEERELARTRDMLSQMIVHDLRSPLTAVTTSLRLLDELVPEESEFRALVEKTTGGSRRAIRKVLNRVDSLLDISKMESGEMYLDREPVKLDTMIDNVLPEVKPLADELNVEIDCQFNQDLPWLDVDSDKIERMILNLVDNALKYTPEESKVIISATLSTDEDTIIISVADRGPGIPDEYKRRLFDRFVQIKGRKNVRRGVGLGLTFCKLAVEAHNGSIWVEDHEGGGSVFKATLPIAHISETTE